MEVEQRERQALVLLLPLPLQGPINCFLKLAHLLLSLSPHQNHPKITFLLAEFIHRRLSDLPTRFPLFNFSLFSDGISGDDPRPQPKFPAMVTFLEAEIIRRLPEFLESPTPATCLIIDGVFIRVGERAKELGIPVVYFTTLSPCCVWASCMVVPNLVHSGQLPFTTGRDMNEAVSNIPSATETTTLRWCDLPGFCRAFDKTNPYTQVMLKESLELPKAQGHILNTFEGLEESLLPQLHSLFPNLYIIGPIHLLYSSIMHPKTPDQHRANSSSISSLWQEDRSCIAWLDAQPSRSVLFVSFGIVGSITTNELLEFWYGLVNSGTRFLWVRRPGSVVVDYNGGVGSLSEVVPPVDVLEGTRERGYIVKWAPQEEVLAHEAVAGFLTHSGWNSTLESIVEGVPMLCWPNGVDQLVNSRFVEQVWKIGIDMKDKCDRVVVEDMVRDLMQKRKGEFSQRINRFSKVALEAVAEGGSSWRDLHRLIEDITFMRLEVHS